MFGQPELIVMCGLSGSGKSTWAKNEAKEWGCEIVSSDDIRAELGDVNDQSQNDKVFRIFYQRIRDNLKANNHVIADATFLTIKERKRLLNEIDGIKCYRECVIMATPYKDCIVRNNARERKVPEYVIRKQRSKFQIPFREEGWDEIGIKQVPFTQKDITVFLEKMVGFDQKNPHHKDSLLVHSVKVAEKFHKMGYNTEYALLHDYGKLFTQTFDDNGIAHYYNHENIGAYELLVNYAIKYDYVFNETLFLTNYHMLPFGWNTERAKEKWRRIFGEDKFHMLMDFHECDKGD